MRTRAACFSIVVVAAILLCVAQARPPFTRPTYGELLADSDLVCVLEVRSVAETKGSDRNKSWPEDEKSYVAGCRVVWTLKGDAPTNEIQIPFWGHLSDSPGISRGVSPLVETTQKSFERIQYLAFLKHKKDWVYVPTSGDLDPALSFRVLCDSLDVDVRNLLLKRQLRRDADAPAVGGRPIRLETR
jgi:hypothetical protein